MLGSARVPRVGFGVAPKQAFQRIVAARVLATQKSSRSRERARQHARRARSPERNRLHGCPLRPE
jgi:hypothetical protein